MAQDGGWGTGVRRGGTSREVKTRQRWRRCRRPPARPEVILNSSGEISDLVYFVITDASFPPGGGTVLHLP